MCPALKLPVYFQSLHQLHWYSLQMRAQSVFVCIYGSGIEEGETIKNDRYGNFLCCSVHFPVSCESQKKKKNTGDRRRDPFLFSYQGEGGRENLHCVVIAIRLTISGRMLKEHPHGCVCGQRLPWHQELDRHFRLRDRREWLVEHSGQNLSDSAKAMNHFGLQLCNLSPTSHHVMASMQLALAHLRLALCLWQWGIFGFMNGEM